MNAEVIDREPSPYGGAVILKGKDYAMPLLESMALVIHSLTDSNLNISLREKTLGNMNVCLRDSDSVASIASVRSIDHFCVCGGQDFETPLLVPSMRKELREAVTGSLDFSQFTEQELEEATTNQLCKLLANLSQMSSGEDSLTMPFASKVKHFIFDRLIGTYSAGLFLNGTKSNVILASKGVDNPPSVGLLLTKNCIALMWYSSREVTENFASTLSQYSVDHGMPPVFIPLNVIDNSVIVIHPQFLVSKWVKIKSRSPHLDGGGTPLLSLNILKNHILNITMPLQDTQ